VSTRLNFLNFGALDVGRGCSVTGARDWIGRVGDTWADEWRRTDRSFADLSRHLDRAIAAAAPAGAFRALDIGCGAGGTTLALAAARTDATIVGIDLSEALVAVARDRRNAADGPGQAVAAARVDFVGGDVLDLAGVHGPFDLLYSRHGVMFFDDPVVAFTRLHSAATPGARLVFSCFRARADNAFATAPAEALGLAPPAAGPGPFAFADRDHVAAILAAAGWRRAMATPVDFAYRAGAGADAVADALDLLQRIGPAAAALRTQSGEERTASVERLRAVIARYRVGDAVDFPAAAWIWSAIA